MRIVNRDKVIFFLTFSIILSLIYNPSKVLAESPIFEFQEIKDPKSDWIDFENNKAVKAGDQFGIGRVSK